MSDSDQQKSYYERDGLQYPRVTHVLKIMDKSGLARWRGKVGNTEADNIAREGSRIGSEFHEIATEINRGRHETRGWQAPGEYRFMAAAYIDWLHRNVTKVDLIEQSFYSDGPEAEDGEPLFAGTVDLVAWFRGDPLPSVIDLKTSNSYSDDWALQLSAYRRLLANNGIKTHRRVIVRIPKVGKIEPEMYQFKDHEEDDMAWMDAYRLWTWGQKGKDRRKGALVVAGL